MKNTILLICSLLYSGMVFTQNPDPYYAPPFKILRHEFLSSDGHLTIRNRVSHAQVYADSSFEIYAGIGGRNFDFTFENFQPTTHLIGGISVRYDKNLNNRSVRLLDGYDNFANPPTIFFKQPNGDMLIFGISKEMPGKSKDLGIERRDASGNILWFRHYGGTGYEYAPIIREAADGSYIGAVWFHGVGDGDISQPNCGDPYAEEVWVFRISASGELLYSTVFGGYSTDIPHDIVVRSDLSCMVFMTNFYGDCDTTMSKGSVDLMVGCLDSMGNKLWVKTYGGSGADGANNGMAVAADGRGGAYVACITNSSDVDVQRLPYNSISREPQDGYDIWLPHIDSMGNLVYETSLRGGQSNPRALHLNNDGTLWLGVEINQGYYYGYYYTDHFSYGGGMMIFHLDTLGNVLHKRTIGNEAKTRIMSFIPRPNGNMLAIINTGGAQYANAGLDHLRSPGFPLRTDSLFQPMLILMEFNGDTDTSAEGPSEDDGYKLFPNPTTGLLYFEVPTSGQYDISVYSSDGRKALVSGFQTSTYSENIGHLASGLYSVVLSQNGKILKVWKVAKL